MSQTRENGTPLFWVAVTFEWYKGAVEFRVFIFIFCLETMVLEINWTRTTSVVVMVIFFSKVSFRNYLITAILKVLSQKLWGTLTTAFERHLTTEDFMDMDQHRRRSCTNTFGLLLYTCFSFSQTNVVFKFNLMLIEKILSQFIYRSTFQYSVNLEDHPVPLRFFHNKQ